MNVKIALVTGAMVLFLGCGPDKDILPQWTGTYVAVDDRGPIGWGCVVTDEPTLGQSAGAGKQDSRHPADADTSTGPGTDAGRSGADTLPAGADTSAGAGTSAGGAGNQRDRQPAGAGRSILVWRYMPNGTIARETHPLSYFELIDQYSDNYGTRRPTWVYQYAPQPNEYPQFLLLEYFTGDIRPHLQVSSDSEPVPLSAVPQIPPIPETTATDLSPLLPRDLDKVRSLIGRHFWADGTIAASHRYERTGYAGTFSGDLFGDGFVDYLELNPVPVDHWTVYPILESTVTPAEHKQDIDLPQPGASIEKLARLVEVREDPSRTGNALVLSLRYERRAAGE